MLSLAVAIVFALLMLVSFENISVGLFMTFLGIALSYATYASQLT